MNISTFEGRRGIETANMSAGDGPKSALPGLRQTIGPSNPVLSKIIVESYEGERDELGRYFGHGKAAFKYGHTYEGEFSEGWMHGEGVFRWADGTVFTGSFFRNTIEGAGKYEWPDGSYYEGQVRGGIRHGKGSMQIAPRKRRKQPINYTLNVDDDEEECFDIEPGPYYEGFWNMGKRHGEGTLWYGGQESASFYKGKWVNGLREDSSGEMVYPSGNHYIGGWEGDRRHGKGVMRWLTSEQIYDGEWKNGFQHGSGTHTWLAGGRAEHGATQRLMCNRFVGEWMAGLRHGKGTFYYSNGSRYVGEFERNLKSGHGVYTFPDGRVYEGPFTDDRMGFNDGSLEEKVATRGPVKVESGRPKRKKKRKKRKGFPQSTPRAVPLAGTTRNVHLNIGDLMSGIAPKERGVERRGIEKLVMRWNSGMKQIYAHYSTLGQNGLPKRAEPGKGEDEFYLNQGQFWMLMRDCGLVSQSLPLASLARIFSTVKLQFASSIAQARRRREASESGVSVHRTATVDDRLYIERDDPVHEPQRPVLYREFVEGLVRIAAVIYEDDSAAKTLPEKFSKLLDGPIRQYSRKSVAAAGGKVGGGRKSPKVGASTDDIVTAAMAKRDMFEWLSEPSVETALRSVFYKYSHAGFGGARDRSMFTREFASLLRDAGVVKGPGEDSGDLLAIIDAVLVFPKAAFGGDEPDASEQPESPDVSKFDPEDDTTNFEIEMIYLEFVETLARVAHSHWHPILLARQAKLTDEKEAAKEEEEKTDGEEGNASEEQPNASEDTPGSEVVTQEQEEEEEEKANEEQGEEEEEEEEEEDPNRLKEETTVLAALQRICEGWIFKIA